MKNIRFIILLLISATILSCSNDSSEPPFLLSNANIAGSYDISNLSISTEITTTTNNIPVRVATASTQGDLFKVNV